MNIKFLNVNSIKDMLLSIKKLNLKVVREFYDKNRQTILMSIIVFGGIFFAFYWTDSFIQSKVKSYNSEAEQTYERLGKVMELTAKLRTNNATQNTMDTGLLSFLQKSSENSGMGDRLANLRAVPSNDGVEHASLRLENLYYDEMIMFIVRIEAFDNLYVKSLTFNRRYDNEQKVDVTLEIVKS